MLTDKLQCNLVKVLIELYTRKEAGEDEFLPKKMECFLSQMAELYFGKGRGQVEMLEAEEMACIMAQL